jgi:pimeloyl-ACP methyl ester carboxylesterase
VLVPGFWLGAWAWDDVVAALRADGHDVTAITLPGLESPDADRSGITLSDHVEAICQTVIAKGTPVVLAVHSGAGVPGYAASDRIPDRLAAMVYVDSGPAARALDAAFDATELPLPSWPEMEAAWKASAASSWRPSASGPCLSQVRPCARPHGWLTSGGWTCRAPWCARRCRRTRSRLLSKRVTRG